MNSRLEYINWGLIGTTLLGLMLAIFLGTAIAGSDYSVLLYIAAFFALISYVAYFQTFTWQIALFQCYVSLYYRPIGFEFGSTEVSCALAVLLAALTVWQKRPRERIGVLKDRSFTFLRWLLLIWIVYVAIHMIYNITSPVRPSEFLLKNALKTYFTGLLPIVILWYFSGKPTGIRTDWNIMRVLGILMSIGLVFNIAVTCYSIAFHPVTTNPEVTVGYFGTLRIPGLNARDDPYILKSLGPFALLFGATALSMGSGATGVSRSLSVWLIVLGFIGALLSSARAAAVTAFILVLSMLLLRKRIISVLIMFIIAVLFVLVVNLSADWINRDAPLVVARPLQWVMVSKSQEATGSIESSSLWRQELFKKAIAEWQSDPRIFWFGRATYGYGVSDFVAIQVAGGWYAMMESSLRRGATHNLLTDLLVTYGLIGCILYYCLILAIIWFLWRAYFSDDVLPNMKALSLICLITFAVNLPIATVGGGLYTIDMIWLLILLIAALYQLRPKAASEERDTNSEGLLQRQPV